MPFRTSPEGNSHYALLCFDADGSERTDDPHGAHGKFSVRILEDVAGQSPARDIFILCHGWKGDVASAIEQYDRWSVAMNARRPDRERMAARRPGFRPYLIGVHWPSMPWGDEELGAGAAAAAFAVGDSLVDLYARRLGDRPGLKEALAIIIDQAAEYPDAASLTPASRDAYRRIDELIAEVGSSGPGASPSADRKPFDPDVYFEADRESTSFGLGAGLGGILAPLRQLSFWKMKQRAAVVGEHGLHDLLRSVQGALSGRDVRVHLMGHSFGCIVVSAMICGPSQGPAAEPVASLALVQGAASLWSYCREIPVAPGRVGHFHGLMSGGRVTGPIVTTRSVHDTALGRFYPLGAGVANQVEFGPGEFPLYGALGAFGAQGLESDPVDIPMLAVDRDYGFEGAGRVYNLEASEFIRGGGGASGAHNMIDGPEVAHAIWQAALPLG